MRLQLKDLPSARKSVATLIRKTASGEVRTSLARVLTYELQTLLQYLKEEREQTLEGQLDRLEERIRQLEEGRG